MPAPACQSPWPTCPQRMGTGTESEGPQGSFREGRRLGPAPLRGPAAPLGKRTFLKNLPLKLETPGASQGYKKAVNTDQAENKRSPAPTPLTPPTGELGAGRKRCVGHAGVELALWPETGVCPLGSGPQQHRTGRFPETQLIGRFNTALLLFTEAVSWRGGCWHGLELGTFWGSQPHAVGQTGTAIRRLPLVAQNAHRSTFWVPFGQIHATTCTPGGVGDTDPVPRSASLALLRPSEAPSALPPRGLCLNCTLCLECTLQEASQDPPWGQHPLHPHHTQDHPGCNH